MRNDEETAAPDRIIRAEIGLTRLATKAKEIGSTAEGVAEAGGGEGTTKGDAEIDTGDGGGEAGNEADTEGTGGMAG